MPTEVQVEGIGSVSFDDSLTEEQILQALQENVPRWLSKPGTETITSQPPAPAPVAPEPTGNRFVRAVKRGLRTGRLANVLGYETEPGPETIEQVAQLQKEVQGLPPSESLQQFQKTPFTSLVKDPLGLPLELAAESLGAMAPVALRKVPAAIALGAAGGAAAGAPFAGIGAVPGALTGARGGFIAGMGLTSLQLEYAGKFMQSLAEANVDTANPVALKEAFQNPAKINEIKALSLRKGIPIGLVDALSAGVAGRLLGRPARTIGGKLAQAGAEAGIQGALGGIGEAAGELVAGEKLSVPDILAEVIAEPVSSVPEVAVGTARQILARRGGGAGGAAVPQNEPTIPGGAVGVEPVAPPAPPARPAPAFDTGKLVGRVFPYAPGKIAQIIRADDVGFSIMSPDGPRSTTYAEINSNPADVLGRTIALPPLLPRQPLPATIPVAQAVAGAPVIPAPQQPPAIAVQPQPTAADATTIQPQPVSVPPQRPGGIQGGQTIETGPRDSLLGQAPGQAEGPPSAPQEPVAPAGVPATFAGFQEYPPQMKRPPLELWNLTEDWNGLVKGSTVTRRELEARLSRPPAPPAPAPITAPPAGTEPSQTTEQVKAEPVTAPAPQGVQPETPLPERQQRKPGVTATTQPEAGGAEFVPAVELSVAIRDRTLQKAEPVLFSDENETNLLETLARDAASAQGEILNERLRSNVPLTENERRYINQWNAQEFAKSVLSYAKRNKLLKQRLLPHEMPPSVTIMGVDSVQVFDVTIDGVRYELFQEVRVPHEKSAIRVTDQDSGEVVTLKQFPTYAAAKAEFFKTKEAAEKAKKPTPQPQGVPAPDIRVTPTTAIEKKNLNWNFVAIASSNEGGFLSEYGYGNTEQEAYAKALSEFNRKYQQRQREQTPEPEAQPTPAPEAPEAPVQDRETSAINALVKRFDSPEPITRREALNIIAPFYGGGMAEAQLSSKDLTDLVELAVNKLILDTNAAGRPFWDISDADAASTVKSIKAAIMDRLPTQTTRTPEQDKLQQFSTPPTLGYVANWVANISATDVALEPSAGVGGLAVFPKTVGARVITNELSDRRADLLAKVPISDHAYRVNAEQLHARLEPEIAAGRIPRPTVVVMNPPFSNAATTTQKNTLVGAKHVEEALKVLPTGGRLVAIVGEGMAADRPVFKAWWTRIASQYNVRANISVSGEEYRKYGTTFGNQLIVIDKTGPTPEGGTKTGSVTKVEDLPALLNEIRTDRPRIGETPAQPSIPPATVEGAGRPEPIGNVPPVPGAMGTRGPRRPTVRGPRTGARPPGQLQQQPTGTETGAQPAQTGTGPAGRAEPATAPPIETGGVSPPTERPAGTETGVEIAQAEPAQRELTEAVFSEYHPAKLKIPGAQPHPTELVESTAMAAVDPPDPKYKPNLPRQIVTSGDLSDAQLEAVVYAGQAHGKELPDGQRQGFFIGDGTGVGKGREIAGVIADNWRQGRKKAVWVSKGKGLINDAKRDLTPFGLADALINLAKKPAAIDPKKTGIAFLTYTGLAKNSPGVDPQTGKLRPQGEKAKLNRFQALYNWLGPDFDGVIAFDETHLAGNAVPVQSSRGIKEASDRGLAVVDLQALFPKARILYVSATGATDVTNLSYADRLGIWGSGTPFPTKLNFFEQIKAGGLSAMEIVSRDLKSMGKYLARTLSFDGVEQVPIEHPLTPQQKEMYDQIAAGWQSVLRNVDETMGKTGANKNGRARAAAMSAFYGAQQRFFNQLLTALQMPTVLRDMEKQLADGNSVVLQIVNTNEATQERELAKRATDEDEELDLESLDLSPKDILLQYISNSFPTQLYEPREDENGNVRWVPAVDAQNNAIQDPEALQTKQTLLDRIALLPVPANPLEMILDTFGVDNVAEVTGRSRRVVQKKDDNGVLRRVIEDNRSEAKRKVEADEFQDRKRRILIFSDAGGTGFSYHASRKAKNQDRRIHYLIQAGWRADQALQGMGRTHRSDQAVAPLYKPVSTDLKGHQRFISTITRRLAQLGALTGGERKTAGGGVFDESSNLETPYAEDAVVRLFMDLHAGRIPGFNFQDISRKMGFVRTVRDDRTGELQEIFTLMDPKTGGLSTGKIPTVQQFLNRILALDVAAQNGFFDEFIKRLETRIENAKADGSYDPGTQTLKAASIKKLTDEVVYEHPESTAKTRLVEVEAQHDIDFNKWSDVPKLGNKPVTQYVRNKRSGRVYALKEGPERTTREGNVLPTWRRIGPVGIDIVLRADVTTEDSYGQPRNYEILPEADAKRAWGDEIEKSPKRRTEKKTYVVGAFLPIWDRLKIPSPKIWRINTDKGETFLGADVPEALVDSVRARLGAKQSDIAPADVLRRAIQNGESFTLANGWKIFRSRVLGEPRLEVTGPDFTSQREWTDFIGGYIERIDWRPRFFISTDEATGTAALQKLLTKSPIVPTDPRPGFEAQEPAPLQPPGPPDTTFTALLRTAPDATAVLDALAAQPSSPAEADLIAKLRAADIPGTFHLLTRAQMADINHPDASAVYLPESDIIAIADDATNQRRALLHELVHAGTVKSIAAGGAYAQEMQRLFDLATKSGRITGQYGATKVEEFVSEAFTSPKFQALLAQIQDGPRNLWQRFVDLVRRLFGLPTQYGPILDRVLRLSEREFPTARARGIIENIGQFESRSGPDELLNPDLRKEMEDALAAAGPDEGVRTKVFNAFDTVQNREQMTDEVIANGRNYAQKVLSDAGFQVEQDPSGFWKLIDETLDQEIEGRRLVETLRTEIEQQQIDAPSKGYLANLLNSVVVNLTPDRVTGLTPETRAELYSLAQGERSHRGLLLGMLSHGNRTVEYVARNVNAVLQRVYSDAFGGDTVRKFVDGVRKSFGGYFTGEVINGAIEANPELQEAIDRINAERKAERIIPPLKTLIQQILSTPIYRQSEIRERFSNLLQKTYEVDPEQAERAATLLEKTFNARFQTAKKQAFDKALAALTPQERRALQKPKPAWKKIEQAVNAGVFETGEMLKRVAQANKWMPLTPEIVARMRSWAQQMQKLRELTPAEEAEIAKFSDNPAQQAIERQRALSDREALTRQNRLYLKKQIETMWSRLTKPMNLTTGQQHAINAAYEWASATLLLKLAFPIRQIADVFTQLVIYNPTRAIGAALDRMALNESQGRPRDAHKEIFTALSSSFKTYLKALRPALAKARAVFSTGAAPRNIEQLISQVGVFERIAQQADEADARGEHAKANILTIVTWVRAARTFASALDQLQAVPAEYQEVRQQVVNSLRERGKSRAEAELAADAIVKDPLAEWQMAVAEAQAGADQLDMDYSPAQIKAAAEDMALARAYQRMREAGMPADDFAKRNAHLRETIGWNVQEEGGLGGLMGAAFRRLSEFGVKARFKGIPVGAPVALAMGRFGNAIATSANRALTFLGGGFDPELFGVSPEDIDPKTGIASRGSPWYRTAEDRRQRKIEAAIGTFLGGAAIALIASGAATVRWKPPEDKEERDLWFRQGHKPYTVEFNLPNGSFIPLSLTSGPMRPIAPYMVGMGAVLDRMEQMDKRQAKLTADALKKGLQPGKARGLDAWDYGYIAGQAVLSTVMGGRTATGLIGSLSDYGIPNPSKALASLVSSVLPPLPAIQEVARMAGIYLDPKLATFWDYLTPMDTSAGRSINLLGDKVSTTDDIRRVIQTATGGSYPLPVSAQAAASQPGYSALFSSGYRPPSIDPNRGYNIRGQFRPFTTDELGRYTQLRGTYLKQNLAALGPIATSDQAEDAFRSANQRALAEMGVAIEAPAGTAAQVAAPPASTVSAPRISTAGLGIAAPRSATVRTPSFGLRSSRASTPRVRGIRMRRPRSVSTRVRPRRRSGVRKLRSYRR